MKDVDPHKFLHLTQPHSLGCVGHISVDVPLFRGKEKTKRKKDHLIADLCKARGKLSPVLVLVPNLLFDCSLVLGAKNTYCFAVYIIFSPTLLAGSLRSS